MWEALESTREDLAITTFEQLFQERGLPEATLCHPCIRVRQIKFGAGEGIRTLDPNLGKVVLYP
jgi:hypothetical protein